jgi:ATP-dependent DNA ligase
MGFQERNEEWDGSKRQFVQLASRSSSPRVLTVWTKKDVLHYQWGQLGGAMQEATEKAPVVNAGKKNEVSAQANALALGLRKMELKHREGYREVRPGTDTLLDAVEKPAIDFTKPLPQSLSFYKPLNSAGAGLLKKAEKGDAWYTRKMNGMMHVIVSDHQGEIQIYSRRMLRQHDDESGTNLSWNNRFQSVARAAAAVMPPNSILLGELVVLDKNGREDFKAIQSITKSLTDESIGRQLEFAAQGKVTTFVIWDIAFWNMEDFVSKQPVRARLDLIHELDFSLTGGFLKPVPLYTKDNFKNADEAVAHAKQEGFEGFVLVDPEGVYGDKAFNFKGKPDRPGSSCAKLKPGYEDDFVVLWNPGLKGQGEYSTKGRYGGSGIKCVALYQYNTKGELTYISNLNSGMTEKMKIEMADPKLWPRVWKVEYKERTYISDGDDTNALTFAAFIEERTDKKPEECINPEL